MLFEFGSLKNHKKSGIAILLLVATILFILSPAGAHAWDPFKIGKAGKHAHQAISELSATVNKLPEQIKETIGSNIKLMRDDVNQLLSRIDSQTVPLLNVLCGPMRQPYPP